MDYFSIGEACCTAFQIKRHKGWREKYFFDSLVTPESSFDYFGKPSDGFLLSGNWDVTGVPGNEGIRLRDKYSGLLFQHQFPVADGKIDVTRVEENLQNARDKFYYLRSKTLAAIEKSPCCILIRAENDLITYNDALLRLGQIFAVFKPVNPHLKVIMASTQFDFDLVDNVDDCLMVKLEPSDRWEGDNASWDRAFNLAQSRFTFPSPAAQNADYKVDVFNYQFFQASNGELDPDEYMHLMNFLNSIERPDLVQCLEETWNHGQKNPIWKRP